MKKSMIENVMACRSCPDRQIIQDKHLEIVYKDIEKKLIDIYINVCEGRCSSFEEYQSLCKQISAYSDVLDMIRHTDVRIV
jgi:hypothetical protein